MKAVADTHTNQDLMWYCQHVQSTLSEDNARLTKDLEETRLDLKDSTKSRRELQKLIEQKELQLDRVSNEHQSAIVCLDLNMIVLPVIDVNHNHRDETLTLLS